MTSKGLPDLVHEKFRLRLATALALIAMAGHRRHSHVATRMGIRR